MTSIEQNWLQQDKNFRAPLIATFDSTMLKQSLLAIFTFLFFMAASAQEHPRVKGWHLLDPATDGYYGIGLNKAYELLKNRKSTTITVAVIDSGIDTLQEDLKPVLWTNPKEIPGNGKDDDGNGYSDDIHGWNFCGAPNGENLGTNTHEASRVFHKWKTAFEGKREKEIPDSLRFIFGQWKRAKSVLDKQYDEYKKTFPDVDNAFNILSITSNLLERYTGKASFKKADIALIKTRDSTGWAANVWNSTFDRGSDASITNTAILKDIGDYRNNLLNNKNRMEQLPVDFRGQMVKDRYEDINDSIYGNNNLSGSSGNHGTHVSGIIGAVRNNKIGVDGIMDNVRIMAIRAVPGGDEHDKDVALAIRYAVDNGARVINMSFGKPVSPYKQMVDDAIRYAASKNVLLVHGAGNDGEDLDENIFYPNPVFMDGTSATNMLTIGASADKSLDMMIGNFSNYSKKVVDIFAPGVYINSTIPNNGYEPYDGTSMASPVAAGVAGLLFSYFPQLTPQQVIDIIMRSGTPVEEEVNLPGSDKKTKLQQLCKSGKIINAGKAVQLAIEMYH